jgi:hypothetical protein
MVKGVWIHQDRQGNKDRATAYAKATCNHANTYLGYSESVKQVDTMCTRCGRRVRFNPIKRKGDSRGQVSQALFMAMPNSTRKEIEARATHLNTVDRSSRKKGGAGEDFTTALKLMDEKFGPATPKIEEQPLRTAETPEYLQKAWRELNARMLELGMKAITLEEFLKSQR